MEQIAKGKANNLKNNDLSPVDPQEKLTANIFLQAKWRIRNQKIKIIHKTHKNNSPQT